MIEQASGNSLYQILAQTLGPHKNSLYSNSMYISVHAVVGTGGDCTGYIPGLPGGDFINLFITQTYKIERYLFGRRRDRRHRYAHGTEEGIDFPFRQCLHGGSVIEIAHSVHSVC